MYEKSNTFNIHTDLHTLNIHFDMHKMLKNVVLSRLYCGCKEYETIMHTFDLTHAFIKM